MGLGGGDAVFGDVDTEDEGEVVCDGGVADVREAVAVGAVEADGGEACLSDESHVGGDVGGGFAVALLGVGGVGYGPLGWSGGGFGGLSRGIAGGF